MTSSAFHEPTSAIILQISQILEINEENLPSETYTGGQFFVPVFLKLRRKTVEPESVHQSELQAEEIKPQSFLNRLQGTYFSPRETFEDVGRAPRILVPIVVLVIISLLGTFFIFSGVDIESLMISQLENAVDQGRITQEQMDQQLSMMSRFSGVIKIFLIVIGAVSSIIVTLILAGYAKLFSAITGAVNGFKALLSVSLYVMIAISIVQSVLLIIIIQIKGTGELNLNNINSILATNLGAILAGFLGNDALPTFIMKLFESVEIFAIWTIVLLSIGYAAVSKKMKKNTPAVWLVGGYVIIAVIRAAAASIMS